MIPLLLTLAVALSLTMAFAWSVARHPGKSGWTDAIWSFAIGGAGIIGALAPLHGAPDARQWLVAALVAIWSLRLGLHIAQRTMGAGDDPRYADLRTTWGDAFPRQLFIFLQIQALAAFFLAISITAAARNPAPFPAWSDLAGALILIVAIWGEGVADRQLTAFRKNPANRGRVCDAGLWGLSRHPNYFFEWLGWLAYATIAIGPAGRFAWGFAALSGPALMYWLLVYASGIPPLEAHMLRSRGDLFRAYQARVRAFFPIPKRPDSI
jgi:steroid 5-alpha reductase family enzyme